MIFYVALDVDGRHHLVTSVVEATKINKVYEQIDVPTDKPSLKDFVQGLLMKIDDLRGTVNMMKHAAQIAPVTIEIGGSAPAEAPEEPQEQEQSPVGERLSQAPPPVRPSYAEQSIKIEDAWESLPLALQLHFAALAMERARRALPS